MFSQKYNDKREQKSKVKSYSMSEQENEKVIFGETIEIYISKV